jgi:hypothetical protein
MSFFTWLTRKSAGSAPIDAQSTGLGQLDATMPISYAATARTKSNLDAPHSKRKVVRLEQRELLYAVVRECMTKSGILSSSYKFKVLSLDSRGKAYLVMVDLPPAHMAHPLRLVEIESLIARHAKAMHDILVTAVYWRVNERANVTAAGAAMTAATSSPSRQQQIEAFKKSFAANETNPPPTIAAPATKPFLEQQTQSADFEDTEIEDFHSPMSGTQYGDLN